MTEVAIRVAERTDVASILELVQALARFEKLSHKLRATESDFLRGGFGSVPRFECLLAEMNGKAVGLALFFHSFSTFEGRSGIYLEDLFVTEDVRRQGVGRKLMARLARLAQDRNCARFELGVLNWNPARDFYHRLGFTHSQDWLPYRLEGEALGNLAREDQPPEATR